MKSYSSLTWRLLNLVRHHGFVFFKSIRCMPPIFAWVITLIVCFDTKYIPLSLVSIYVSASMELFFIITWISYVFLSSFNQIAEYISVLKINSRKLYFASKIIFLSFISMLFAVFGCLYPVVLNVIYKTKGIEIFQGGIHLIDVSGSFILYVVVGLLGASVALLFQPNLTKSRDNFSLGMILLFVFLAVTKGEFFTQGNALQYVFYVFPPLIEIGQLFIENTFGLKNLLLAILYGLGYSVTAVSIGYWLHGKLCCHD